MDELYLADGQPGYEDFKKQADELIKSASEKKDVAAAERALDNLGPHINDKMTELKSLTAEYNRLRGVMSREEKVRLMEKLVGALQLIRSKQ